MKKIIVLLAMVFIGTSASFAQDVATKNKKIKKSISAKIATPQVEGAGMLFENETLDYGTIAHNADGKREFKFINNGNKPLIIETATGSCGCTVPTKPNEPIMPGGKGVIGVKYATDRVGQFTKQVTIKSNAAGQESKVLTIKGNVLPDATPAVEQVKS